MHWPGSMGGGSGTQLGGAMGGDTGSWWSLDDGPDSWRPRPAALRDLRIISLRRRLVTTQRNTTGHWNLPTLLLLFSYYSRVMRKDSFLLGSLVYSKWHEFSLQTTFLTYSVQHKNSIVIHPLLLEEPVLFPELLLETTEMALAIASTADRRSANVFLSDLSASEMKQHGHLAWRRVCRGAGNFIFDGKVQSWETLVIK